MADYKNIKGFNIQYLDSDPPNPIEGQMWFNSTTQTLKGAEAGGIPAGTWASGGNMNTTSAERKGAGIQNDGLLAGGRTPAVTANTEVYNGTSWTEVNDLNQAKGKGASSVKGTSTSLIYFGGEAPTQTANTESWNGTSWTEVNNLPANNSAMGGSGTATAALSMGGYTGASTNVVNNWDGTSWSTGTSMTNPRYQTAATGTFTDTIITGSEPATSTTEFWNGTSWTELNDTNTARNSATMFGTTTSGILVGNNPSSNVVESWNGTSWSEIAEVATPRLQAGCIGASGLSGFAAGGLNATPAYINATEEWNVPEYVVKTFTTS